MLTSTTVYALADVPFALLFVIVIGALAGELAWVPVVVLPLALFAGLAFQSAIAREARRMTAGTYRKNGLLVETLEGAESLRAAHGEWQLAARPWWRTCPPPTFASGTGPRGRRTWSRCCSRADTWRWSHSGRS